ncbi:MAG: M14 family metallopeptidase [Balneolales bacterium]|nr:M14 family metallopeptidase [Balneolales bacterium]
MPSLFQIRYLFVAFLLITSIHGYSASASATTLQYSVQETELSGPEEFLGYAMGERLTPHHRIIDYIEYVADNSDKVLLEYYGHTYGGRKLAVVYVSSPDNIGQIEEIRSNNLIRAGLYDAEPTDLPSRAIVWLSYNVHGNEISASEAALFTLYELASGIRPGSDEWLENTVVIIDPLLNPDGRDRYVNWYHSVAGRSPNAYPVSREHIEPWPNARTNYYQFDLNRDWAWQSQIETRQRMALYHQWMPHIHADFHEMGVDSPYYFAPAAEPFHESITDWQREFQTTIGENHARYFDENYRVYFTREIFDLFYPSYGDTYPTYNGAIGMTYEQAGNTRGGLSVITAEGDTLTFERRILNQHIVGMSTVEVTSKHFERVTEEFFRFFREGARNPYSPFKTYVVSGNNHPDKLQLLTDYLDAWDITYGRAPSVRSVNAFDYQSATNRSVSLSEQDIVISAYQPKSALLNVLFEPRTTIVDSLTYDITAWAVPYAMGLEAYALESRVNPTGAYFLPDATVAEPVPTEVINERPYAYITSWNSKHDVRFLSNLLQQNIRVHVASRPIELQNGNRYERGSLIIMRRGHERLEEQFDRVVTETAQKYNRSLEAVQTGMVRTGPDFGSQAVRRIHAPRVALIAGPGVNPNNFGEIWHFMDRQIEYPVTVFEHSHLGMVNMNDFDVLIMPQGGYASSISSEVAAGISRWVRSGGKLIVFGDASRGLGNGLPEQSIRQRETDTENDAHRLLLRNEDRQRDSASELITGSIYYLHLDNSHPLAFGYPEFYYTLKSGARAFDYLSNGSNVGTLREGAHRSGFEGYRVARHIEDSMVFGVQPHGSGELVFLNDNPLFRAFWHNGKLLFSNALFFVGQ